MKAMILAAGLGTRLRPLTDRWPKPAIPFLNVPLFFYSYELMREVGLTEVVVNIHHLPEQIVELCRIVDNSVQISNEAAQILGSGGAVWKAREWLEGEENFLLANGDEVILPRQSRCLSRLVERHRETGALATLLVMRHHEVGAKFGGVWCDGEHRVLGFGKCPPAGDGALGDGVSVGLHYVGVMCLSSRIFRYLPDGESNILYDGVMAGIRNGEKVLAFEEELDWFETGNPTDFLHASRVCLQQFVWPPHPALSAVFRRHWSVDKHPIAGKPKGTELGGLAGDSGADLVVAALQNTPQNQPIKRLFRGDGARISASAQFNENAAVVVGNAAEICDGVVVGGECVLGPNSFVGPGARIKNVILMPGANIASGAVVVDRIVMPK